MEKYLSDPTGSGRNPHSVPAITSADPVDPALSNSPLGDSRNHSVLQRREGNAGLQPRMVLEDLLGGYQPSVSPGESSHYLFIRNERYQSIIHRQKSTLSRGAHPRELYKPSTAMRTKSCQETIMS